MSDMLLRAFLVRQAFRLLRQRRPQPRPRGSMHDLRAATDDEVCDLIRSLPAHYADTYTLAAQLDLTATFSAVASGDNTGNLSASIIQSLTFDVDGGTVPTVSAWVHGTVVAAAGNWLIADPDPFQSQGNAVFQPPLFAMSTTHKLKFLYVANNDGTYAVTMINGASAGTTIFDGTASHGNKIEPGGFFLDYDPAGIKSGALTTTTNDKITLSVAGGTPSLEVLMGFGL